MIGEAVVLASSRPGPRHREDIAAGEVDVADFGEGRHTLRLEVRVPGQDPYEVEDRFKVPADVQFGRVLGRKVPSLLRPLAKRSPIPVGLVLPVQVDPANPDDVTIDWDGFLAAEGREKMSSTAQDRAVEKLHSDYPEQAETQKANAKQALDGWVAGVQNGTLKRKAFEQSVETQVRLGFLDPADADAARAKLDG